MEKLFLVFVLISIIWSVLKKLKEAKEQKQAPAEAAEEAEPRPMTFAEMLRRELERQQPEAAGEIEVPEAPAPFEAEPEPPPEPVEQPVLVAEPAETRRTFEPLGKPSEDVTPGRPSLVFDLPLDASSAKRGIVLAELLGPCVAMRQGRH